MNGFCAGNLDICSHGEKNKIEYKGKLNCFKLENIVITETFINVNILLEITNIVNEYI